jgi:hypothetical protein
MPSERDWLGWPEDVRAAHGARIALARTLARSESEREALLDKIEAQHGHKQRTRAELLFARHEWTERQIKRQEAAQRRAELEDRERDRALAYAENPPKGTRFVRPGIGTILGTR